MSENLDMLVHTKEFLFLKRPSGDRAIFQEACLEAASDLAARKGTELRRLVLNLVGDPPPDRPYRPPSDIDAEEPAYDALMELAVLNAAELASLRDAFLALLPEWAIVQRYAVEEAVEKDEQPVSPGPSPGLKYMGRLVMHADLPDDAARRCWSHHAALAIKVHVGMTRYVRNVIVRRDGPDATPARGIVELYFPSREVLLSSFFDSERGRYEILHDTAHFVAEGSRFYVGEHVLIDARARRPG